MSYNYWNNFINNWRTLPAQPLNVYTNAPPHNNHINIFGWTNPNSIPLFNRPDQVNYSLEYLPEPWWGNNGNYALNSVVVNYNPGWAEDYKHYSHPPVPVLYNNPDYSVFAGNEAFGNTNNFPRTNRWHHTQRAQKIFSTLQRTGTQINGNNNLVNHLSIELIPWHTTNIRNINFYIDQNLHQIYNHCLIFAADQANRIDNERLNNKVILRFSGSTTMKLLYDLEAMGISNHNILIPQSNTISGLPIVTNGSPVTGTGKYLKFTLSGIPGTEFISIWGETSRNAFPPPGDMDYIFLNII